MVPSGLPDNLAPLLGPCLLLPDLIQDHQQRCAYRKIRVIVQFVDPDSEGDRDEKSLLELIRYDAGVRDAVERFQPDVAHIHNTWFSLSTSAVAAVHKAGLPGRSIVLFWTCHQIHPTFGSRHGIPEF